jgi:uncharacterized protein YjbI with pentapeptide repeats
MANKKQLAILRQGVDVWNEWRRENYEIEIDLSGAELSEANLIEVNLYGANLYEANLYGANLSQADLIEAKLIEAKLIEAKLIEAKLIEANLSRANLIRANLYGANLYGANLIEADLIRVNLIEADLSQANLIEANLRGGNLRRANLNESNISTTNALGTNFKGAILTGACIEYWNINSQTNLDEVICDYIYQKSDKQERRPHNPERNFAPGEFTKLFQKALETVDLIFSDGIEWAAFLASFEKLQVECGSDELAIQAIEKKSGGAFVIRVEVPPDADKAEVEKYLKQEYEIQLKAVEDRYRLELNAKDNEIEIYKQKSTDILELAKLAASRPINISQTQGNNMAGDRNIHMGSGNYNERIEGNYVQGNYYASGDRQTLSEAAAEIQRLLKQLEETNPTATTEQQQAFVNAAVSPTLKARFVSALQSGWKEAMKEFLDNPYVNVGVAVLEGWHEAE